MTLRQRLHNTIEHVTGQRDDNQAHSVDCATTWLNPVATFTTDNTTEIVPVAPEIAPEIAPDNAQLVSVAEIDTPATGILYADDNDDTRISVIDAERALRASIRTVSTPPTVSNVLAIAERHASVDVVAHERNGRHVAILLIVNAQYVILTVGTLSGCTYILTQDTDVDMVLHTAGWRRTTPWEWLTAYEMCDVVPVDHVPQTCTQGLDR